jgi:hypothetical protein
MKATATTRRHVRLPRAQFNRRCAQILFAVLVYRSISRNYLLRNGQVTYGSVDCLLRVPHHRCVTDLALHLLSSLDIMQLGEIHRRVVPLLQMDIISVRVLDVEMLGDMKFIHA